MQPGKYEQKKPYIELNKQNFYLRSLANVPLYNKGKRVRNG
jgi:hypothetical protein